MKPLRAALLAVVVLFSSLSTKLIGGTSADAAQPSPPILGFRDSAAETSVENRFLAVPDPKLAEEHLRTLTRAPHMAGTLEDKATADYVASKFREAGLETEIVEYRVWMNYPASINVDITAPAGVNMHGPSRERVDGDPFQDDSRVVMPFNGMSPSGDVEAEVVYANYGTPEDFAKLEQMKIDVRGKIVIVRYGQNFRGVKEFMAQERGAAGVLIADERWHLHSIVKDRALGCRVEPSKTRKRSPQLFWPPSRQRKEQEETEETEKDFTQRPCRERGGAVILCKVGTARPRGIDAQGRVSRRAFSGLGETRPRGRNSLAILSGG